MKELTNEKDYEVLRKIVSGEPVSEEERANHEFTRDIRLDITTAKDLMSRREILKMLAACALKLTTSAGKCIHADVVNKDVVAAADQLLEAFNGVLAAGRLMELYKDDELFARILKDWTNKLMDEEKRKKGGKNDDVQVF